jgi:hypothetical protein
MRFDNSFARLASALCLFFAAQSAIAQTVFINEIHYDNTGGDSGEAIEVAGPAGTDLAGWSVVLYNGSSTQLKEYGTIALSGVIPDLDSGFGVLSFARAGIQNGSPDGLALVDASDVLVPNQFLSYEGSFTPIDGPAAGLLSTDIGEAESGSAAVGSDSIEIANPAPSGVGHEELAVGRPRGVVVSPGESQSRQGPTRHVQSPDRLVRSVDADGFNSFDCRQLTRVASKACHRLHQRRGVTPPSSPNIQQWCPPATGQDQIRDTRERIRTVVVRIRNVIDAVFPRRATPPL